MRIPRIFVDTASIDLTSRTVDISHPELRNQLLNVLRLRPDALIDILDGVGSIYRCALAFERTSGPVKAKIIDSGRAAGEPQFNLIAALPVIKDTRFEWAVEKLTELGASKIMALETERCVRGGPSATSDNKLKRWRAIAKAAALQCERALIPDVVAAQSLPQLLEKIQKENARILIGAERSQAQSLLNLLTNDNSLSDSPSLVVLVGPEGGFTENEFKMVELAGAQSVTLGKRILRSETAAVYAASLIVGCLDK